MVLTGSTGIAQGGDGASSPLGGGGDGAAGVSGGGSAATGFGAGGGGAMTSAASTPEAGGNGAPGVWIIDEYS
jgi:hypothetical protein